MKNFLFLFLILTLSACVPQVTVTSQVTVTLPLPTETPIPTPTITFTPTPIVFTQDQLSQMTDEEKINLAPETGPGGLVRGNVSEVKSNLVKYYDSDNNLVQVYDLTEGKFKHTIEAGIIEFNINNEILEMLSFDTGQKALGHVANDALWYNGDNDNDRFNAIKNWQKETSKYYLWTIAKELPGRKGVGHFTLPNKGENFFPILINSVEIGTIIVYPNKQLEPQIVFVFESALDIVEDIENGSIDIDLSLLELK